MFPLPRKQAWVRPCKSEPVNYLKMTFSFIVGIIGMLFILVAFILDEFYKKFNQNTIQYNVFNLIGSALLTYYAFSLNSLPFIILNLAWFAAAAVKLVRIVRN